MTAEPTIVWRQEGPAIYAAYITGLDGPDLYVGYAATSPDGVWWRGYVGLDFAPVGRGPRLAVQAMIEQTVRRALGGEREEQLRQDDHSAGAAP